MRRNVSLCLLTIWSFLPIAGLVPGRAGAAAPDDPYLPDLRPLSAAERRAVELAVAYLDGGPEAWWPELAESSPARSMGREAAVDEIAVRAGPPAGARWTLRTPAPGSPDGLAVFSIAYPSGVEETLTLLLTEEADGWRILELSSLADPARTDEQLWETDSPFWERDADPAVAPPPPPGSAGPHAPGGPLLAIVSLLLVAAFAVVVRPAVRRSPIAAGAAAAAAVIGVAGLLASCARGGPEGARTDAAVSPTLSARFQSLGDLRELRWALASGAPADEIRTLAARVPAGEDIARLVSLWRAETVLSRVDLRRAEDLLAELPDPSPVPLGDLLRARFAYARGEADAMAIHYEQVGRSGTDHDGLRYEAAEALASLGRTAEADVLFQQAANMGSRLADVHYAAAAMRVLNDDMEAGERYLARAWALEPVPREVLFARPLLAALCARPTLFPTFSFDSPEEPLVIDPDRGRRAIGLPAGAVADLSGGLLRVGVATAAVYVPGGAALAPADSAQESAEDRRRRLEDRVLARLPELMEEAWTEGILARPRRLREMTDAATALARHNRWAEIVRLTEAISDAVEVAPPLLGQLRAVALQHGGRTGEAQGLLVRLAKTSLDSRRKDPAALRQLAELFVAGQDYDLAIRLMKRAERLSPLAASDARVRQVRMEKELYEAAEYHDTDHFQVVFPGATGERYAADLGWVLEEERQRISSWIPVAGTGESHTVHLYPLFQFLEAYSGGVLVLGIYDGRLSVPFAELRSLHPELVSVVSHELAHAMLARATDDQAPKWFHEGLAQHVEMMPGRINPIPDLHREGRILSFPMIEAILAGFAEPQLVDLAYSEAAWVVHYIEEKHGARAIRGLIDAYADGATTEEAVERVFGMTVAAFDRAVWDWCLNEAPASWPTDLRRYDRETSRLVRRTRPPEPAGRASAEDREAVRSWHRIYSERTREVKRALAGIVGPVRSGELPSARTCIGFERRLEAVLDDPRALAAPLPAVRQNLQVAFRTLLGLAVSCRKGDARASRESLRVAETALARAAGALEEYGLSP